MNNLPYIQSIPTSRTQAEQIAKSYTSDKQPSQATKKTGAYVPPHMRNLEGPPNQTFPLSAAAKQPNLGQMPHLSPLDSFWGSQSSTKTSAAQQSSSSSTTPPTAPAWMNDKQITVWRQFGSSNTPTERALHLSPPQLSPGDRPQPNTFILGSDGQSASKNKLQPQIEAQKRGNSDPMYLSLHLLDRGEQYSKGLNRAFIQEISKNSQYQCGIVVHDYLYTLLNKHDGDASTLKTELDEIVKKAAKTGTLEEVKMLLDAGWEISKAQESGTAILSRSTNTV